MKNLFILFLLVLFSSNCLARDRKVSVSYNFGLGLISGDSDDTLLDSIKESDSVSIGYHLNEKSSLNFYYFVAATQEKSVIDIPFNDPIDIGFSYRYYCTQHRFKNLTPFIDVALLYLSFLNTKDLYYALQGGLEWRVHQNISLTASLSAVGDFSYDGVIIQERFGLSFDF